MGTELNRSIDKWLALSPTLLDIADIAYGSGDGSDVLPERDRVFRAFEQFPPEEVRVVILGQDPYHSTLSKYRRNSWARSSVKASGLSFGFSPEYIRDSGKFHSSLLNIRDEVRAGGYEVPEYPHQWYTLENWAAQGVLLLNTRLTVEEDRPMSHASLGWEGAITLLLQELIDSGTNPIFLSWGAEARSVVEKLEIPGGNIIATSHPCKYSNTRTATPFTGSNCFRRVNDVLTALGKDPIVW